MTKRKKIPTFSNEQQEQDFWASHDSNDYIDWQKAQKVSFTNLKPSTKVISLRLPEDLLNDIKILAHKNDVPYQSYIKILLYENIKAKKLG